MITTKLFKNYVALGRGFSSKPTNAGRLEQKRALVERLLDAKQRNGRSFRQIADQLGVTNAYCAQLFHNQAHLKPETAKNLHRIVPEIDRADLELMQRTPFRCFDANAIQEPLIYRLNEAMSHYGESIKAIVNEEFGDGIMSAIDIYITIDKEKGKLGEDRVVVKLNGKFLPHVEQKVK